MTPDELSRLATESTKYDNISSYLGILNIFLVLLTAFVTIGTFYYGNKLSSVKEKIANQKIAQANANAAVANQKAQDANASAELAKVASASANNAATEAKNKQTELAIELRREQQKLNESNTKRIEAELALSKQVEQVKERQRPRSLTIQQQQEFIQMLQQYGGTKARVLVMSISGNNESAFYADQIFNMLLRAGWDVVGNNSATYHVTPIGLDVVTGVKNSNPMGLLVAAFKKIGVQVQGVLGPVSEGYSLEIVVGTKP